MAIGDSLQQLIATRRAAKQSGTLDNGAALRKESSFEPALHALRKLIGGLDARYVKHKLTKNHAAIRVGQKNVDLGWDIQPNPAVTADGNAPPFKVAEARNFMREDRQDTTLWFTDTRLLIDYLEQEILRQIATYEG